MGEKKPGKRSGRPRKDPIPNIVKDIFGGDGIITDAPPTKRETIMARSLRVAERLEELECDPVTFCAKIMNGSELKDDHKYLPLFVRQVNGIINAVENNQKPDVLVSALKAMLSSGTAALTDSVTPKDLRATMARELLKYIAPQLKAIDVNAVVESNRVVLTFDPQDMDA